MRFLSVLLISVFFFSSTAYAEYDVKPWEDGYDLMKDNASAWLKTRKWPQEIVDKWNRARLYPVHLSQGFDNPVCHVFADENNLMAGKEGLGKYPENPKEYIAFDKWENKTENRDLRDDVDDEKNIEEFITFDLYNTGKPVIIGRLFYITGGEAQIRGACAGCTEWADHLTDNYVYRLYNTTDLTEVLNGKYAEKPTTILKDKFTVKTYRGNLEYDPYMSSFFTYGGISYMAERNWAVYRFNDDKKEEVCTFDLYSDENEEKKLFSVADKNMKQTLAEYYANDFRRKGRLLNNVVNDCIKISNISKELTDFVNNKLEQKGICEKAFSYSNILSPNNFKSFKLKKTVKDGITTFTMNGKFFGTLRKAVSPSDSDSILDEYGTVFCHIDRNKVFNLSYKLIGIIEKD